MIALPLTYEKVDTYLKRIERELMTIGEANNCTWMGITLEWEHGSKKTGHYLKRGKSYGVIRYYYGKEICREEAIRGYNHDKTDDYGKRGCFADAFSSAFRLREEVQAEVRGRDMLTGLPKTVILSSEEIRHALDEPVTQIIDAMKSTLDKTPPELAADIMDRGIVLAGGGALLQRLGASNTLTGSVTPILGLTRRGDLRTKLRAFDLGVDDIMTLPFSPEELLARARRRNGRR